MKGLLIVSAAAIVCVAIYATGYVHGHDAAPTGVDAYMNGHKDGYDDALSDIDKAMARFAKKQ